MNPVIEVITNHEKENLYDYEFEWDYPSANQWELLSEIKESISLIKKYVIPNVDWLDNFKIFNLSDPHDVGIYINGTSNYPHICLNSNLIKDEGFGLSEILITILHELYHSYQDASEDVFCEDEAESFGIMWESRIKQYNRSKFLK